MTWLLLIYTVPAHPPGKRASVWREVKRAGAVYVRDGVCALPEGPERLASLEAIALRVRESGGNAILAQAVQLDESTETALLNASSVARSAEYADLSLEVEAFLIHLKRESRHRDFGFTELDRLEGDLAKLRRWYSQIASRAFEVLPPASEAADLLGRCDADLTALLDIAYRGEEAAT